MVAIAEAYTDALSELRFADSFKGANSSAMQLLESYLISSTATWKSRRDCFANHHSTLLSDFADWQYIMASVEVRNSIAHGLGSMSAQQKRDPKRIIDAASKLKISLNGPRLSIHSAHIYAVEELARSYVEWLDFNAA
ncbi:MAG: hypothetical protein JWM47_2469 [Acidimicrobiales bacterium]|nr:hypothetical protein [Acidimicrobiales bacterium]